MIGSLLSAPPPRGELKAAIEALAEKVWTHPVSGQNVQYTATTIEGWYYKAKNAQDDPVSALAACRPQRRGPKVRLLRDWLSFLANSTAIIRIGRTNSTMTTWQVP